MTTQPPPRTPPPPRPGFARGPVLLVATAATLILALGAVIALVVLPDSAAASEVTREPVATAGANPFMPSVGSDATGVTAPPGTGGTFRGDTAGLYGGTRDDRACDGAKLVRFLDAHPAQAAAWSGVLGIRTTEVAGYVSELTPVQLRADTLVTNHGYAGGRATVVSSVLQAGSAVFVDRYGSPVVRCACGNPLTAPTVLTAPIYVGPTWASFSQTNVTVVQTSTVVINNYTLVDPRAGRPFTRPRSSDGTRDGDSTYTPETASGGQSADTGPSTGSSGSVPEVPAAPFDPLNADYSAPCGPASVRGGSGSAGGTSVSVAASSAADLTGDGRDDTAVLLECGSGSGGAIQDVQVFGSDGTLLSTLPTPQTPAGSPAPPRFDPSTFALSSGSLRTGMQVFGPQDTTTPSLSQTWTWRWNGSSFAVDPASVTPVEAAPALAPDTIPDSGVDAVEPVGPAGPVDPVSPDAPASGDESEESPPGAGTGTDTGTGTETDTETGAG